MKKTIGFLIFCLAFAVISVAAQTDRCFKNDGLKVQQTISFTITKNKIEGTFESGRYERTTSAETFEFTGTKTGNLLIVKFNGKPPYELPPQTKRIVWTLATNTLRIPMYGKNYNSQRYSTYTATFAKCKEI